MTINLIPYGQLPGGNFGINVDNGTGDPIAVILEVKDTLPAVGDPNNFDGRLVYAVDDNTIYVFIEAGTSSFWDPMEGTAATVDAVDGNPPTSPTPTTGSFYWDTDTEILFIWDGFEWQRCGGRYSVDVVEKLNIGTGTQSTFPLGTNEAPLTEHVEAFLGGVRQVSNNADTSGGADYAVVGTNIVFATAPAIDVEIFTRSLETVEVAQTAEAFDVLITAVNGQEEFDTGRTDIQSEAILVSVNGATQVLDTDYTVFQADTTISSLTKTFSGSTEAVVVTNADHGIVTVGTIVQIWGYEEDEGDGDKYEVIGIDSSIQFRIEIDSTEFETVTPECAGCPYFTPSFITNKVVFSPSPFVGGEQVYMKMFKSLTTAPVQGESNTLQLLTSALGQDISAAKVGEALQVKGILAGTNISVTDNGDDLVIASATGATSESRSGATGNFLQPSPTESYVGVSSTPSTPVTVDMSNAFDPPYTGAGDPNSRGRRILIKDEGGNAGTNNITVIGPSGASFETLSNYTINVDFGAVEFVFDDTNWWITQVYP